jgi:hypothetical protein
MGIAEGCQPHTHTNYLILYKGAKDAKLFSVRAVRAREGDFIAMGALMSRIWHCRNP